MWGKSYVMHNLKLDDIHASYVAYHIKPTNIVSAEKYFWGYKIGRI